MRRHLLVVLLALQLGHVQLFGGVATVEGISVALGLKNFFFFFFFFFRVQFDKYLNHGEFRDF